MKNEDILLPEPAERMSFTGERYVTGLAGNIGNEHYHRYLFAMRFCIKKDVLDIASGEGYGSSLLASVARSVVGVDIDEASVRFARRAYSRENLSYCQGSVESIPLTDASVDVVVCYETLEHVAQHGRLLDEITRVLRKGGILIISTPDRRVYTEEPVYHNPYHVKELDRGEFQAFLQQRFPYVSLYEQQVLEGSVLARCSGQTGGVESFATADASRFIYRDGLPRAPYLLAVASPGDSELPAVSLLSGLDTDATLGHSERDHIRILLAQERDRNAELECRIQEVDYERGYLRAMITAARERNEILHAAYEKAGALQAAERKAAEQQLEAIRTSTSWRLTGPMRVLMRSIRKVVR